MHHYRNLIRSSIRAKLILFLLLAITVPMLLSIYVTNIRTKEIVTQDTLRQTANLVFQGKTNLAQYLDATNQASLLPYNDTRFGDALYTILEQGRSDYLSEQAVLSAILSISQSVSEIHQVYLYAAEAGKGYLARQGNRGKADQSRPDPSAELPEGTTVAMEPTHQSHNYGIRLPYYPPEGVITIHRHITQVPSGKHMGYLAIDISTDVIDAISNRLYDPSKERLYLLSEDRTVVYGPDEEERGTIMDEAWAKEATAAERESGSVSFEDDSFRGVYVYEKITAPYMDWTLVKLVPNEVLAASTHQVTRINTYILGSFVILTAAAAVYVSFRMTTPILTLIRYVNRVQAGDLEAGIDMRRSDEIGLLANRFRRLMETINNLILREYRLELANKSNQLKALQAQVQPHFLYNALQSIGTLALQHQAPKVYTLIAQLAKMMRYSMNGSDSPVTVAQEIEHVKAYLDLQKQRFGEKLTVEMQLDSDIEAARIPRMIVQPIVENCFKHGFDPAGGLIRIRIGGSRIGDTVTLTVEDDGAGMRRDKLEELNRQINPVEGSESLPVSGIGLANVAARLRLYCGPEAGIRLEPVLAGESQGVRVVIRIPKLREEDSP